jgi:branched-chain amino acid transport system ATP-binding protein
VTADGQPAAGGSTSDSATAKLLEIRDLTVHHGQLQALSGINLEIATGDVHAIIGANGAGKSTLLRTIAGLHRVTSGSVRFEGIEVTSIGPEARLAAGIALVPEGRRLFASLTVEDNLIVGAHRHRPGPWSIERVYATFEWMAARRLQPAGLLSGGEQQAVAIGRALVANPRLLLLDELSLGLAPKVVRQIYRLVPDLLATGMTILIVEQDVRQAVRVASRIQCLLEGRTTLLGQPGDFSPSEIEAAYFGLAHPAGAA